MGPIGIVVITLAVIAIFSEEKIWTPVRAYGGIPIAFIAGYFLGVAFWPEVTVRDIRFE